MRINKCLNHRVLIIHSPNTNEFTSLDISGSCCRQSLISDRILIRSAVEVSHSNSTYPRSPSRYFISWMYILTVDLNSEFYLALVHQSSQALSYSTSIVCCLRKGVENFQFSRPPPGSLHLDASDYSDIARYNSNTRNQFELLNKNIYILILDCFAFPSLPNYFWPTIPSVAPHLLMSSYQDAPIDYSTSSRSSTSHSSVKSEDVLPFFPNQTSETILRTDINNSYERDWVNLNGHQYFHQSMVNQNMWLGGVCFDSSYSNPAFNYNCDAALV